MAYSCFEIESDKGVAHVRMSRPKEMNSMNRDFWRELPAIIRELEEDPATRVVVLSSSGAHFSAGMDLSVFQTGDWLNTKTAADRNRLRKLVLNLQNSFTVLEQCRFPVLAAIQGGCIGGAVDMVAACDLRYATTSAFFCIQEINLAMMADLGTLQRLPALIPLGIVKELAYTGDRLPAERAKELGLVNEVFQTEEEMLGHVMTRARTIAQRSPLAIAASKEAINYARDHAVDESLSRAADLQSAVIETAEIMEAFKAKTEKREPVFADLKAAVKMT